MLLFFPTMVSLCASDVSWSWQNAPQGPYLTCGLLGAWHHGFFSQHFDPQTPETLGTHFPSTPQTFRVKQVHGRRVVTTGEIQTQIAQRRDLSESGLVCADGIVGEVAGAGVWVASADCTPVLIGDRQTGLVVAVHAGWRGTAQKIVPTAIARLQEHGGQLPDLRIALGPAISGEMYQVTETVAAQVGLSLFPDNYPPDSPPTIQEILAHLESLDPSPIQWDPAPGKVRLHVSLVSLWQLHHLGFQPEQLAIAPYCTYQIPEHFFSYRRTQQKQVQWSGIVG